MLFAKNTTPISLIFTFTQIHKFTFAQRYTYYGLYLTFKCYKLILNEDCLTDDEDTPSQPLQVLRRQADEPRPSVADMPGTSSGNGNYLLYLIIFCL